MTDAATLLALAARCGNVRDSFPCQHCLAETPVQCIAHPSDQRKASAFVNARAHLTENPA